MANLGDILAIPSPTPQYVPMPTSSGHDGLGLGGGLLGGVLLGSLLARNGGLFGNSGVGATGVEGLNNLQGAIDTNAILSKLATIEGLVPLTESQVQLALAGVQSTLTNQGTQNTQYLGTQLQNLALGQLVQSNAIQTAVAAVDTNVDRQSCAIQTAIHADGEATRALITANTITELNRIAAERQDEIIELRGDNRRDRDRHGIEINMINNQNQNQLQFQQQAQALGAISNGLTAALQSIHATNQAINIGGTQTANPVNTNTNVRA